MSNLSRIEVLKEYTEQEPENPFNWYALALEYQNANPDLANDLYLKLLKEHESYLPTYFHAALFFAEKGDIDLAKSTYESGIQLAIAQNNTHALKELKNSYQNFIFENDL